MFLFFRPFTTCWARGPRSRRTLPRSARKTFSLGWTRTATATWRKKSSSGDVCKTTSSRKCWRPTLSSNARNGIEKWNYPDHPFYLKTSLLSVVLFLFSSTWAMNKNNSFWNLAFELFDIFHGLILIFLNIHFRF